MGSQLLGKHFDIHGGGQDLQFPHHENEIAQSEGAHQCQFVNYWMHNGFVRVDDEKMSKSLGNFFTIREVLKKYDAEVVRFFILRAHYRSPLNYSDVHLDDARQALTRLYTALKAVPPARSRSIGTRRMRCASRRRWTMISARPKPWPCCSTWPQRPIVATQPWQRS
jgi:cysteinyl-tRNA synthetase